METALISDPYYQASAIKNTAMAYARGNKDYQFILDQIEDPDQKLRSTIDFYIERVEEILKTASNA